MASTTYDRYFYDQRAYPIFLDRHGAKRLKSANRATRRAEKRNSGQLPQPFWLGAACGGGSCSAARCAARA
nr:MAG TPA_asm: hypothetical protein [Caudoviricetes sp.]